MSTNIHHFEVKNLGEPDECRDLERAKAEVVHVTGAAITRATLVPGWRWSQDLKPVVGTESCQIAHTGVILQGRFHIRMDDGRELDLGPGDAHVVAPGHDAWVVGDEPVVAIDFASTGATPGSRVVTCPPCGVEFRVASIDQIDHLVAAVQQHALASHNHQADREHILAELGV